MSAPQSLTLALLAAVLFTASCLDIVSKPATRPYPIYHHKLDAASILKTQLDPASRSQLEDTIIDNIHNLLQSPEVNPLLISQVDYSYNDELITLNVHGSSIEVTGLSGLHIDNLDIGIFTLSADFATTLPSINVTGNYNVDGNIQLPSDIAITGNGPFEVTVSGIKLSGTVKVGLQKLGVYIKSLKLNIDLEDFSVNFENIMNDPELSDIVNEIINSQGVHFFENNKEAIQDFIAREAVSTINSLIEGLSLDEIIDIITGGRPL